MNKSDLKRNYYMLKGPLAKKGYDWWWHSLTAYDKETGEDLIEKIKSIVAVHNGGTK